MVRSMTNKIFKTCLNGMGFENLKNNSWYYLYIALKSEREHLPEF